MSAVINDDYNTAEFSEAQREKILDFWTKVKIKTPKVAIHSIRVKKDIFEKKGKA